MAKYDTEQELLVALGNFSPKQLSKVCVVVVALPWVRCLPLEVFFTREKHFWQSAISELKQALGGDFSAFEVELYRIGSRANAFLLEKGKLAPLRETLARLGVKKAKFVPSAAASFDEIPRTESREATLWVDVNYDAVMLCLQQKGCIQREVIPIPVAAVLTEMERVTGKTFSREILYSQRQWNKNPQTLKIFHSVGQELSDAIVAWTENCSVMPKSWIIGGVAAEIYPITPPTSCETRGYRIYWNSLIADTIEITHLEPIEPLLPAIFSTVSSRRDTATYRSINAKATSRNLQQFFCRKECVAGTLCVITGLLFCVQYLGGVERKWGKQKEELIVHRDHLSQLAQQIDQAQQKLLQKQDLLSDVAVYDRQNHAWNAFFSQLQAILSQTGDVFLTDFQWKAAIPPSGAPTKNSSRKKQLREKPVINDSPSLARDPVSIELSGAVFTGNSRDSVHWNASMNQMFNALRKIAEVDDVCEIKVYAPVAGKITFRCRLQLKPDTALLAV